MTKKPQRLDRHPYLAEIDLKAAAPDSKAKACAWPGCDADACYKAPASKDRLRDYVWFCLEHVREYNRQWDYFAGMSSDEIDRYRRDDVTWHRPSWRFGGATGPNGPEWHDPFEFLKSTTAEGDGGAASSPDSTTRDMMRVLELEPGFSEEELKAQYKRLAKRHHPDLQGGDRDAEERLKRVNAAYAHLREHIL